MSLLSVLKDGCSRKGSRSMVLISAHAHFNDRTIQIRQTLQNFSKPNNHVAECQIGTGLIGSLRNAGWYVHKNSRFLLEATLSEIVTLWFVGQWEGMGRIHFKKQIWITDHQLISIRSPPPLVNVNSSWCNYRSSQSYASAEFPLVMLLFGHQNSDVRIPLSCSFLRVRGDCREKCI